MTPMLILQLKPFEKYCDATFPIAVAADRVPGAGEGAMLAMREPGRLSSPQDRAKHTPASLYLWVGLSRAPLPFTLAHRCPSPSSPEAAPARKWLEHELYSKPDSAHFPMVPDWGRRYT